MKKWKTDLVVIGGGAAGMMAAATAAAQGVRVQLLEPNAMLGKKLRITGKGRCNVTNDSDLRTCIANTPTNGRFLYAALSRFGPEDVMAFFTDRHVPLKTERGNRVFPVSDRAADIVSALERELKRTGVQVCLGSRATRILTEDGHISGVELADGRVEARAVIVATGGCSYPLTGSTGDGYRLAKALGHSIVQPVPSLVPLEVRQGFCREMQGLSLRNVRISVYTGQNKMVYTDFGEMLFTHFGVSGPLILSANAHMRDFQKEQYYILLDLKPALDEKKLDLRILRDFEKYHNRDFQNALGDLLNRLMIPVIVKATGIPPETKVHSITKAQRRCLLEVIEGLRLDIQGPRPLAEAIVTSGGVQVREVEPKTMASKLVPGLYFAGEVLDVDAYTGGFNLQIAWSTGHAAGSAAAEYCQQGAFQ